ncbi:hypothetical protein E2C01_099304 [Portunus trituberculatus]|uniref:Uncharacterized protein n=1 Tax=Portunus trituberculatus TaxID=210409 RepID=A0A5B7KF32_PORTR|nr:hypothetical protein [Portunus trituberculatus]
MIQFRSEHISYRAKLRGDLLSDRLLTKRHVQWCGEVSHSKVEGCCRIRLWLPGVKGLFVLAVARQCSYTKPHFS